MIVQNKSYKINLKTGQIVGSQRVRVACDNCSKIKETLYKEYKRRKNRDNDYCTSCSNSLGITGCKGRKSGYKTKKEVKCNNCGIMFKRYKKDINSNPHICCSIKCSFDYKYKKRYEYLLNNWKKHYDELCYLMGLILGDGTLTKYSDNGTVKRIGVYCDAKGLIGMKILLDILSKLKIKHTQSLNGSNCVCIGFSVPNSILDKFGMNFCGNKYTAQPTPNSQCFNNINFAIGLFNSDGYFVKRSSGCMVLSFGNTVKNIISSMTKCLDIHGIHWRLYTRASNQDKGYKAVYSVYVERQGDIRRIIKESKFKLKEMRHSK